VLDHNIEQLDYRFSDETATATYVTLNRTYL